MKPWLSNWMRPALGGIVSMAVAAGLAYKIINGYRHPSPDVFLSVEDRYKASSASPADPVATTAAPIEPPSSETPGGSANADSNTRSDWEDNSACEGVGTEQREIKDALKKQFSAEEGRYLQRRLLELDEQRSRLKCQ